MSDSDDSDNDVSVSASWDSIDRESVDSEITAVIGCTMLFLLILVFVIMGQLTFILFYLYTSDSGTDDSSQPSQIQKESD